MKQLKNFLKQLAKDESGQGAAEYILLIALVVTIVFLFGDKLKAMIQSRTNDIDNQFNRSF